MGQIIRFFTRDLKKHNKVYVYLKAGEYNLEIKDRLKKLIKYYIYLVFTILYLYKLKSFLSLYLGFY